MSSIKHWGETHQSEEEIIPDVTAEIERSMSKSCLDQFVGEETTSGEIVDHVTYITLKLIENFINKLLDCSIWIR